MGAGRRTRKHSIWVGLASWALFCAWCVHGFPPSVDLPAHGAQMQTLADIILGRPDILAHYRASFPLGYGGTTWLFLPLAMVANGSTAVRVACWLSLFLMPLALAALSRAFGRSLWPAVLGAPLAFSISYWFGFLPTQFAIPLTMFFWAGLKRAIQAEAARWPLVALLSGLALLTLLCHVLVFGALLFGAGAILISARPRASLRVAAWSLGPAFLLSLVPGLQSAYRIFSPSHSVATGYNPTLAFAYDAPAHLNWIAKAYGTTGQISVWLDVIVALTLLAVWWMRRRSEPPEPVSLFVALFALYLVTPKSISGAWLVHARLAIFVAAASLFVTEIATLPRYIRASLVGLALLSMGEVVRRHTWFAEAIAGLDVVTSIPPPAGVHGGGSLVGFKVPGSRITFIEHLPQWWTAEHGGVGTNFFADAEHQPVRFVRETALPAAISLEDSTQVRVFSGLLVFGSGPLPDALDGFDVVTSAGAWRRLERRAPPHPDPSTVY